MTSYDLVRIVWRAYATRMLTRRLLCLALAVTLSPATAAAHATLLKSEPAAGAVLQMSPTEVRLRFNEEVLPGMSGLVLVLSDGSEVNLRGANDSHDIRVLTATLPHLPPGGYGIRWRVISADGHPASGTYSFLIVPAPAVSSTQALLNRASAGTTEAIPILAPLLRGIGMTALLALTGMLGFLTRAEGDRGPTVRPTLQWTGALAVSALFLHLIAWTNTLQAPNWHVVLDSAPGRLEQLRVIFAFLLLLSVLSGSKRSLGLFFGILAIVVSATIGHPGTIRPLLSVPLILVHLAAVAAWVGGVAWLVAHRGEPTVRVVQEAARVSNAALVASILVLATGVVESCLLLRGFSDLVSTSYGFLILAKTVGLAGLIGFGWYHRFRQMPRISTEKATDFIRTLRYELALMTTVVIIAGFLAYTPTPR
jgi:copper transport protein